MKRVAILTFLTASSLYAEGGWSVVFRSWENLAIVGVFAVALAVVVVKNSSGITTKWFTWDRNKELLDRIEELEKLNEVREKNMIRLAGLEREVGDLKSRLREDDLNNRVESEFRKLKNIVRVHRRRFVGNVVSLYSETFHHAFDEEAPDCSRRERRLENKYYKKTVSESADKVIAPDMVRAIFENNFKDLPEEGDSVEVSIFKNKNFSEDARNRCVSFMKMSYSYSRDEWESMMSRDVFETKHMANVEEQALREGVTYFKNVIEERNKAIKAMFAEYGDMFHSYESFKKFIEHRYMELY